MTISIDNRQFRIDKPNQQSLHYLWAVPPSSFLIHNAYNVVQPTRAFLGAIDSALTAGYQISALPVGFTSGTSTPSGAASRIADWQEYFGYYKGYNRQNQGNYWGFLILQNYGVSGTWNSGSLLYHQADKIGNYFQTPFTASGIASWSGWTTQFASGLKNQLDTRSGIYFETLSYPQIVDVDYEETIDQALPASGTGWWILATGDSRYGTQNIVKVPISGTLTTATLSGVYSMYLSRGGSPPDITRNIYHANNTGFLSFMNYLAGAVRDYALTQSLYNPLKVYFPEINCGNYGNTANINSGLVYDGYNPNGPFTYSTGSFKVSEMDHQSPDLYGPQMVTGRFDNTVGLGSTSSEIWRNYNKNLIDACVSGNVLPVIPWTTPSGTYFYNSGSFTPSQLDLEDVWNYAASKGISNFKWFYESSYENYDKLLEHIKYVSSRVRYYTNIRTVEYGEGSGTLSGPGGGGGLPEV